MKAGDGAFDDGYPAIDDGPEVEVRERASRFVGQAFRVASEAEAAERLALLRKRTHDASHHVFALRLAPPESPLERADDDGEPAGSSGPPILAVLRHRPCFDALVVVTRWFGGTKLGTGGLARAYGEAARLALDAAPSRHVVRTRTLEVLCGFEMLGVVESEIARASDAIAGVVRHFDAAAPRFEIRVLRSHAEALAARLVEATAGRARVSVE